ncbi:hypothetical protein L1987_74404 [Smallanthus sonchifolius]|uniref:Uncharacterized protein n=1 Tax=Smallanthus sonchifolius TaxID=185202 RepID=A0ACB9A1V4_9ASTR|nr:hypothetical protein L1987_74404 [Smallanthus sonchifolius]
MKSIREKEKESVKERLIAPKTYAGVYLRRKLPKDVPYEPPLENKSKKRRCDVYTSRFDTQKLLLEARIKELDATKLKPHVNVEEASKEIYSTHTVKASVKVTEESKATWFKKKPKTRGKYQGFKDGEHIFKLTVYDLKTPAQLKMLTTHPKGYDYEISMRRMANDGFQAYKKNPSVSTSRMTKFKYNVQKRLGEHLEKLRMYEFAQMRCLTPDDIATLSSMPIHCKPGSEFYVKDFENLLCSLSREVRGILQEE